MKASKNDVERLGSLSVDCGFLLSHLIRQDSSNQNCDKNALDTLRSILSSNGDISNPVLKGGKIGWYGLNNAKIFDPSCPHMPERPGYFSDPKQKHAVCFTESTLFGLKAHVEIFNAKYGLAFTRKYLLARGVNPCLNIREDILKSKINEKSGLYDKLYNFIPDSLTGYVNIINDSFDAIHEREWRILGNFEFVLQDIFFIFCPSEDFHFFSHIQKDGMPNLFDLKWLDKI